MSSIKQATLALALLAGTALGAQAQTGGNITSGGPGTNLPADTGSSSGTGIDRGAEDNLSGGGNRITTGGATTGAATGRNASGGVTAGTSTNGSTMPSNSTTGTGPAGSSVAGRPTSPGNSATPVR